MATIGLSPVSLRNALLTVAEDDYTAAIGEVTFTPEVDYGWHQSFDGRTSTPYMTGVRWVCMLTYVQDFTTPDALSIYLVENAAQVKTVTFTPTMGGRSVTGQAMIVPGQLGGVAGGVLTANVTLPLYGSPVISAV